MWFEIKLVSSPQSLFCITESVHVHGVQSQSAIQIHSCLLRSCLLDGDLLALDGVFLFQEGREDLF